MIKVEITNAKAPWPAGATVGAVVVLAVAIMPAWAVGKCRPLAGDDDREPCATWEPPQIDHSDPQARAFVVNPATAAEQLAEQAARVAELGQQLLDAEQALGTARAEILSLGAQLAEARGQAEAAARAQLAAEQALRDAVPATVGTITGDGTGEPLPLIEEVKAGTPAKASKKAAA